MMDPITFVPLGIGIASICLPLIPLIGTARGKTMSRSALCQVRKAFVNIVRETVITYSLRIDDTGGWLVAIDSQDNTGA